MGVYCRCLQGFSGSGHVRERGYEFPFPDALEKQNDNFGYIFLVVVMVLVMVFLLLFCFLNVRLHGRNAEQFGMLEFE
jgi:Na+/melibiose symporter-like transporter